MAAKKGAKVDAAKTTGKPKFPYSTKPNSIRKFLDLVPKKPKPPKVNADLLKAWGLKDNNDQTIIRVLKAIGLVGSNNEPTEAYTQFMTPGQGPAVLAAAIREVWAPMFQASHEPHREGDETLKNYFNIHSGGSEKTISLQIQSFKALCDYADFEGPQPAGSDNRQGDAGTGQQSGQLGGGGGEPRLHIDLHIHLPENKSRRDYEYIFEDIARHILGRSAGQDSHD